MRLLDRIRISWVARACSASAVWVTGFAAQLGLVVACSAYAADPLQAFPPADGGMVRHVLWLPAQEDESTIRVELMVGRTMQLDSVNRYFFIGKIEEKIIEGWGFPRYVVDPLGPMAGTRIAPDPKAPRVSRFVTLGGEPLLLGYNSRLPLVVYTPEGVELRYRLWRAGPLVHLLP